MSSSSSFHPSGPAGAAKCCFQSLFAAFEPPGCKSDPFSFSSGVGLLKVGSSMVAPAAALPLAAVAVEAGLDVIAGAVTRPFEYFYASEQGLWKLSFRQAAYPAALTFFARTMQVMHERGSQINKSSPQHHAQRH